MKGSKFTSALRTVSKSMQQAQHRALSAIKLPRRWPSREEIGVTLQHAGRLQAQMERIQASAERHTILMNADIATF